MSEQPGSNLFYSLSRWIITLFTILMVVMAGLAGNGIFKKGDMEWLVTGHMHLGNLMFAMAVAQMVLCYVLFIRTAIGGGLMLASALVMLFTFGQIGLGYSTRNNYVDIVGWHIALGVALTAAEGMLTTMLWMPAKRPNGANTAG